MRIIIDADACPKNVKKICEEQSIKHGIELIMVIDEAHEIYGNFIVIKVGQGMDSVDHKIITTCIEGDIIVTQDYGLASILLQKSAGVIHPKGFLYTIFNIESLMFQRHMGQKIRKAGGRTKGPKKRTSNEDKEFEKILISLLEKRNHNKKQL
ncbi:YaiI/YqxD family protein [uncultured Ilyobacter sp.]|uniref:YaiI/YqxD family protein n=1 Tax=uncultured Ilyobacter sp. TaxID=544433 RepID=UPI0029C83047|nr:YaiI/YqxD family protein [uncultured Ilyobacter sp.]